LDPVQETRTPQRLYAPSRSSLRPAGALPVSKAGASPWKTDHPWQPAGQDADYESGKRVALIPRAIVLALIALFNFALMSRIPILRDLAALLDVFGVVFLADTLLRLWQSTRRHRMRWTTFPAFLGKRLEGVLLVRPTLEPIGPVRAVLRCVRDEKGSDGTLEPTVLYQQISEISIAEDRMKELPLSFDLPPDLPGTDLNRDDATYWQIALRIPVVGPDVEIVFLAPVYPRS